ncbi:recombination protein NinB [Rhizobium leguminosarum]
MTTRQTVTIQTPDDRRRIATWARNVEAGTVVTFRKKSRSTEQSAKMWAMLGEVSDQVEWYGAKLDAEDWKDVFTASLRHARVVPGIDKGTFVPLGMHTSTLTIEEMSNLIELIYAFGADPDHPVVFKDPKETTEPGSPSPEPDADASLSASAEGVDMPPSTPSPIPDASDSDGGPASGEDPAGGEIAPSQPPAGSVTTETEILIRFASDILPKAANPEISTGAIRAIEKRWIEGEIAALSDDSKDVARLICAAMRNIANGKVKLKDEAVELAEVLGCEPAAIGG